jgi:lipid-binding SYLF domain-containing protein
LIKQIGSCFLALLMIAPPLLADDKKEAERLQNCGSVLKEIMDIPDDIPTDLIDKAECIIVYPSVLKAAFVIGGSYGRGAMTCRSGEHFTGPWSAPSMMALEGGSIGFQIGGQATDFVLLVMNPRGARSILKSKVKLGADASAAAGPKGRDASANTDDSLRAEVLSYSRSRGVFAGISLEGSTVVQTMMAMSAL